MKSFICVLAFALVNIIGLSVHGQDISKGIINTDGVKIYEKANTKSKVLITLQKGVEVNILESKSGWHYIEHESTKGYIRSQYINKSNIGKSAEVKTTERRPQKTQGITLYKESSSTFQDFDITASTNTTPLSLAVYAVVKNDNAALFKYPSAQSKVIANLPSGTSVFILDKLENWYKCDYIESEGWIAISDLKMAGTKSSVTVDESMKDAEADASVQKVIAQISNTELKNAAGETNTYNRQIRSTLIALRSRSMREDGSLNADGVVGTPYLLTSLEGDISKLRISTNKVRDLISLAANIEEKSGAEQVIASSDATIEQYTSTLQRFQKPSINPNILYGGYASLSFGQHKRTSIYDYQSSVPNLMINSWITVPQAGTFRPRLDYSEDIVTTKFSRMNAGVDWRLPQESYQFTAKLNFFNYKDEITINRYSIADVHAGWEQIGVEKMNLFIRGMYQAKNYTEKQPQAFTAYTVNAGSRYESTRESSYDLNLLNRYQKSDDMGLNFDLLNANFNYRFTPGFAMNTYYEGYFSLADSGGAFLNYHRLGIEARWSNPSGLTDYGMRLNYRYHPDAVNLTYGQASLFMGHSEASTRGTNWDMLLMYQLNNGELNPHFVQANFDLRSTSNSFYLGTNFVGRYLLAKENDSLSQHFTDISINPGIILNIDPVRLDIGPFIGSTIFLQNKVMSIQDNLNNYARTGINLNVMTVISSMFNIRGWGEFEKSFYFKEDPYIKRKRQPTRYRVGAEMNARVWQALTMFVNIQMYAINNDTGVKISLPSGARDRDKIDDTQIIFGARYSL